MVFLCLSSALFVFLLISSIFFGKFSEKDYAQKRIENFLNKSTLDMADELSKPFVQRFFVPAFYSFLKFVTKLFPKKTKGTSKNRLEKNLKLAGLTIEANEFSAIRLVCSVCIIAASFIFIMLFNTSPLIKFLIVMGAFVIVLLVPNYFLIYLINKRQEEIKNNLPDVMDLICVSVEAGLAFDAALMKVEERYEGPLVDEFVIVHREMQLGRSRKDAFKNLVERSNVEELKSFASAIIQAEQLGMPIKNILNSQAQLLRQTRKQRAEEKAMKAPVKMMAPLALFIFPVIFIILLGPTIIQVTTSFGR